MDLQTIKQRYGIIGNDPKLLQAIHKAIQVAPTDLSILVIGESGVGKDIFSRIIHENSLRKHSKQGRGLISVNCGAIPEGTIESELFGHVKGAFTGADKDRKGYFEEADGGTIFLDEIGELPLAMQVKLLRVLENGEIIPVGMSAPRKVDVRIVAATNIDLAGAVRSGHFREDLYYRLQQILITIPPLRERKEDIPLLFRKFSSDVAEKYHMPPIFLSPDGREYLMKYPWYGNIRELRNVTEQIAVVETERTITRDILRNYLGDITDETMPALWSTPENLSGASGGNYAITDRELLLKALSMGQMISEMRNEINDLRQVVAQLAQGMPVSGPDSRPHPSYPYIDSPGAAAAGSDPAIHVIPAASSQRPSDEEFQETEVVEEDSLALEDREKKAIILALQRHGGKRNLAAKELHISERTLYRKIKEYDIEP